MPTSTQRLAITQPGSVMLNHDREVASAMNILAIDEVFSGISPPY